MRSAFKSPVITGINLTGTEPKGPESQRNPRVKEELNKLLWGYTLLLWDN